MADKFMHLNNDSLNLISSLSIVTTTTKSALRSTAGMCAELEYAGPNLKLIGPFCDTFKCMKVYRLHLPGYYPSDPQDLPLNPARGIPSPESRSLTNLLDPTLVSKAVNMHGHKPMNE